MIVKFDPEGIVKMTLGRKPEAIDYLERYLERGEKVTERYPVGSMGTFNRETDIAWDAQDNMFISDGYGNSRVREDREGRHLGEGGGNARLRPQPVQHAAWYRHRRAGQRLRRGPRQFPHPGL